MTTNPKLVFIKEDLQKNQGSGKQNSKKPAYISFTGFV